MEVLLDDVYHLDCLPWNNDRSYPLRVIDIGAHVGSFAFAIALAFPGASITCYEPSPVANSYLDRNVQRNGLTSRIQTVAAAVGTSAGRAVLHQTEAGSAGATLFSDSPSFPGSSNFEVDVDVVDVADAFKVSGGPELVKLDCEGSEYAIVLDSDSSIWSSVRCVLLEYHPVPGHSWTDLETRFEDLGFNYAWHDPNPRIGFGVTMLVRL
jgi:FkbM family methyltransferase